MYRRLGYYPTETSEHSSEYVPWYLHHPSEVERLRLNVGEYVGISEDNLAEYQRVRDRPRSHGRASRSIRGSTEYAPQVIHSLETGTAARHRGQRGQPRADHQPARRFRGGGADRARRTRRASGARRRPAAAVRRAQPLLHRSRRSSPSEPRWTATRAWCRAAAMLDPNTAATLTVDQIWQLCDELDDRARRPPARGAAIARPVLAGTRRAHRTLSHLCAFLREMNICAHTIDS